MSKCLICRASYSSEFFYLKGHLYQGRVGSSQGVLHRFDKTCIIDWLTRNPTCPICREDLPINNLMSYRNPNFSISHWVIANTKDASAFVRQSAAKILLVCHQMLPIFVQGAIGIVGMKSGVWAMRLANESEIPIYMTGAMVVTIATLATTILTQARRSFGITYPLFGQITHVTGLSALIGTIEGIYIACVDFDLSFPEAIKTVAGTIATASAIAIIYDKVLNKCWTLENFVKVVFTLSLIIPAIGGIAGRSMASTNSTAIICLIQITAFAVLGFYITHKMMNHIPGWIGRIPAIRTW